MTAQSFALIRTKRQFLEKAAEGLRVLLPPVRPPPSLDGARFDPLSWGLLGHPAHPKRNPGKEMTPDTEPVAAALSEVAELGEDGVGPAV
jgi:hypothetical protein